MVVLVARVSLAILAEVGVMANSALVANALNIRQVLLVGAERPIAIDAVVAVTSVERLGQGFVNWNKAVAGVDELGVLDAVGTIVPVGAVQAFMADAIDELVTAVAYG